MGQMGQMGWIGKVLGGGVGLALGGPLGALAGVALGHGVDRWFTGAVPHPFHPAPGRDRRPEPQVQGGFFYAVFAVMGHLAKADGRVSEGEIALAESVMSRLQLSPEQRRLAIGHFNEGKAPDFPLDQVIDALRRDWQGRSLPLRLFLDIQFQMAYADGALGAEQTRLLLHMARRLGLSEALFRGLDEVARAKRAQGRAGARAGVPPGGADAGWRPRGGPRPGPARRPMDALATAYAVLGVPRTASETEVKRAYRRLLSQHHPDKLVSRGLPPDMLKLADAKTHEIRQAYETIAADLVRSRAG